MRSGHVWCAAGWLWTRGEAARLENQSGRSFAIEVADTLCNGMEERRSAAGSIKRIVVAGWREANGRAGSRGAWLLGGWSGSVRVAEGAD